MPTLAINSATDPLNRLSEIELVDPEPATIVLLASGLGLLRRRTR